MIDLENKAEDIIDMFVSSFRKIEKTIGLIADKELVEYVMECIFSNCYTSAKYIDLIGDEDIEHIIYVEADGSVTVFPIEKYADIDTVNTVYIDMDGAVNQDIINYCVNSDKEVILFGQNNEDDECDGDCDNCMTHSDAHIDTSEDEDGNTHGFTVTKSRDGSYVSYSYYSSDELNRKDIQEILKAFNI